MVCSTLWFLALFFKISFSDTSPRHSVNLNGVWQYYIVPDITTPPEFGQWTAISVPGTLFGYDYKRAWFRRSFTIPAKMRGSRIKIEFDGVKYDSQVYINGKKVGGCSGGYDPFEVDITDVVQFDGPNELAIGCHDWTATFSPGESVDFDKKPDWQRPRRFVQNRVIAPIGGRYERYGIWGDVRLVAHPAVYIRDLFIKTSVRRSELVIEYTVANELDEDAELTLRGVVEDQGNEVFSLTPIRLRVSAGKEVKATISRTWSKPRLWSHIDPHLYHLRTELSTGDVLRTRFGFREFWVEGHRFYLNGIKINLLASSWWPQYDDRMTREEIKQRWESLKKCGCVAFRTHTQPWRSVHYDVADEVGLLMIIEGAMWHDPNAYCYDNPIYWENFARHLKSMVARDKNRPSVLMWSLENEAYGGGKKKDDEAYDGLARKGRLVKKWDPTRPIYCESDADPGGVFDAIGCHYPHEYPQYHCWPNEAYWLEKGTTVLKGAGRREFTWEKRKPLYVGEFLWAPSGNIEWHTLFFGDEVYAAPLRLAELAKAECWKMQIIGFRHAEVAGISPWSLNADFSPDNPLHQAHQYTYQHMAAYCHNYDSRFYSGETVRRKVEVFNDVMEPSELHLKWNLFQGDKVVDSGSKRIKLGPAGKEAFEVCLHMPEVPVRAPILWRLTLTRGGKQVFTDTHQYAVFPPFHLPALSARVGLYDPRGDTKKLLESCGLSTVEFASLGDIKQGIDLLIIGAKAFAEKTKSVPVVGQKDSPQVALSAFVNRGGCVLVLEQDVYPDDLFPVALGANDATITFPLRPSHPALRGLNRDDLRFWRGDHIVAKKQPRRPTSGYAAALLVSGTSRGIDNAPLLELKSGLGTIVFSQMELVQKALDEPAAGLILDNLLRYLAEYQAKAPKTALVGGSQAYRSQLRTLGLLFDDLTGKLDEAEISPYTLIVCRERIEAVDKLRAFAEKGGNVLVHRALPESLPQVSRMTGLEVKLTPYQGAVKRTEGNDPILEAIAREDVYWYEEKEDLKWAPSTPPARAKEMSDGLIRFSKSVDHLHYGTVTFLTEPPSTVAIRHGSGTIVVDQLRWDGVEARNHSKANRYACSLLATLGGEFTPFRPVTTIECEAMTPEPGIKHFRNTDGYAAFACHGAIQTPLQVASTGRYKIELIAGGTHTAGVYPVVEVCVDRKKVARIQLTDGNFQSYLFEIELTEGKHNLAVAFVNDANINGQDRNLKLDKMKIEKR